MTGSSAVTRNPSPGNGPASGVPSRPVEPGVLALALLAVRSRGRR
ncbi:hypothetical protein ACIQ7Q_32370 [Streptomyces sp. NPDC096176]